ncbi:MAG: C39 family peptidase [Actinomycetota bacterium]|nr:C39 family peptidase [Actinomycetota bacterium]
MKHLGKSAQVAPAKARSAVTLDDGAIMTPGIRDTTSIYLTRRDSALRATIITRTSFNGLYSYIDSGISVVVWSTMYFGDRGRAVAYQDGYTMYNGTHAVTLAGYNASKTKVLVSDPLSGSVWRDASRFKYLYEQMGKQAVVIQ